MSTVILLEGRSVRVLSRLKCCEMFKTISVNCSKNLPQPWPTYQPRRHEGRVSNLRIHLGTASDFGVGYRRANDESTYVCIDVCV